LTPSGGERALVFTLCGTQAVGTIFAYEQDQAATALSACRDH